MNFLDKGKNGFNPFSFDEPDVKEEGLALYIKEGNLKEIKKEINEENINKKIISGSMLKKQTPLEYLINHCEEDNEVLEYILSLGADINFLENKYSNNVLEEVKSKSANTIKILSNYGLDININIGGTFSKQSLLGYFISQKRNIDEVKTILEIGAKPLIDEDIYSFALNIENGIDYISLFFDYNITINNALEFAYNIIETKKIDETKKIYLLYRLYDITKLDFDETIRGLNGINKLPIIVIASNNNQKGIVKFLIEKGFDFKQVVHRLRILFNPSELISIKKILINSGYINKEFFIWDYSYDEFKSYINNSDDLSESLILLPIYQSLKLKKEQKKELIKMAFNKNACADEVNKEYSKEQRVNILYIIANSPYFKDKDWFAKYFIEKGSSIEFNNNSALLPAIWQNYYEICEILLENGADLNFFDSKMGGWIDAFYMKNSNLNTSKKRIEMYKFLKNYGFEFEGKDGYFNEVAHHALSVILKNKDYKFASYFLKDDKKDLKLHFNDIKRKIFLMLNNNIQDDVMKEILKKIELNSINRNTKNGDKIPFLYAFIHEYLERERLQDKRYYFNLIEYMLQLGANPNLLYYYKKYEDNKKFSEASKLLALITNHKNDNRELVKLLLDYGADYKVKTSRMKESLIFAIVHRNKETTEEMRVKYLELLWNRDKFDLEERNNLNSTPLIAASQGCHYLALKWLIEKGANINVIGGFDNSPPLHKAISNHSYISPEKRAKTVEVLVDAGVNIEEFDSEDFTPLMSASYYGCNSVVSSLIKKGADINKKNVYDMTALHCAVVGNASYDYDFSDNKSNIISQLVNHNADINTRSTEGFTPLIDSIRYGYKEVFSTLLRLGADIEFKDTSNRTPLMLAIEYSDIYFVNKLWTLTKNFSSVDKYGEDLFMKAVYRNNPSEAKMIIEKLIELGYKPVTRENRKTILHSASSIGNYHLIPFIINLGLDINGLDKNLYSPIDYLILSKDVDGKKFINTLDTIIDLGGDINEINLITSIKITLDNKNMEYRVTELIKRGAPVKKALNIAKMQGENYIIDYLEDLMKESQNHFMS